MGVIYHYLGLEFTSPLINILWKEHEYAEFIQDPLFYLDSEMTMVRQGDLKSGLAPIARIGSKNKFVQMNLIHNISFEQAKQQWDRRKKRINPDNIIIKMGFSNSNEKAELYFEAFKNCKFRKILFCSGDEDTEDVFKTNRFIWSETSKKSVQCYNYYDYMMTNSHYVIDLLKLLTGQKEYSRER